MSNSTPKTLSALDELMVARERATKGEWEAHHDPHDSWYRWRIYRTSDNKKRLLVNVLEGDDETNARFITLAYNSLPSVFEEVEKLRERARQLAGALVVLLDVCSCQNGCDPDDMTCATNIARNTLKLYRNSLPQEESREVKG